MEREEGNRIDMKKELASLFSTSPPVGLIGVFALLMNGPSFALTVEPGTTVTSDGMALATVSEAGKGSQQNVTTVT